MVLSPEIPNKAPLPKLTRREVECLGWSANGKTAWEIAQIVKISEATATFHIENAKEKLGAKTLPQAVAIAVSLGIIKIQGPTL